MSQTIHQLCQAIAKHPSKINLINQALEIALQSQKASQLKIILDLIETLKKEVKVGSFLQNKNKAVFIALLALARRSYLDEGLMSLIGQSFSLSEQSDGLALYFVEQMTQKAMQWTIAWPANLLAGVFEQICSMIELKNEVAWELIINMVLELPTMAEIEVSAQSEPHFKKNFQKLILSILASEECPTQELQKLYHGLGVKVLSKMSQPLALANHCLHRFAQNPEVQIEVLSCIFLLVGKYGLQLQEFYPKLEKLILYRKNLSSIYELPNSRRFFKLLEAALRSSRVPFKTVSTFAHILIRQLPGEIGEFAFWSLSFIVNLTKKHRKLLDQLPLLPEIQALKRHYNTKVRSLVGELFKNLNKTDYLEIEDFTKLSMVSLTQQKISSAISSLNNEDLEFKIPVFEEQL